MAKPERMNQSISNGLSLYFETPYTTSPSLQQQIQQLLKQRGALRHISIKSLQTEIDQPTPNGSSFENGDEAGNGGDNETGQARQERIWKAREEMLQKLAYAQNEILSALDFVSLLLSGSSAAAQTSMSPALKERVPTGSVERKSVEKQKISLLNKQKLTEVSEGWKSQSFESASETFSQAADRLDAEAQRQSRYWDQVASLKAEGWSISRLPSDSRAIGVHYGFSEAAPQFRSRSFALLQQDDSGNLQLDPRSIPESTTATRVAIIRNGIETGTSHDRVAPSTFVNDINKQISQARDAIFEEELFHELSRETRLIANQGARTQPKAVEAQIDSRTTIRITQVDSNELQSAPSSGPDDLLAEIIALNIRLLLLLEHNKSKQRRSSPPSAMSLAPQTVAEYAILRPVLANLRHQAALKELRFACDALKRICTNADLEFEVQVNENPESQHSEGIQKLRQPVRSTLVMRISEGKAIEMDIESYLGSPIYGTVFRSKKLDFGFLEFQAGVFSTVEEATDCLMHALTLELIAQTPEFEVLKPHSGEIIFKATEKITATVNISAQRLLLLITGTEKVMYTWRPEGFQCSPSKATETAKSFNALVHLLNSNVKR